MNKFKRFLERTFQVLAIAGLLSFNFITPAFAAVADDKSVLLTDSRPSTVSDWTVTYDQGASGTFSSTDTYVLTIPTGFSLGTVDETDIDFKVAAADETLQTAACGATDTIRYTVAGQVMTFEACSSYTSEAAGSIIEIQIGLNAAGGDQQITNHATAAVYTVISNQTDEDPKDALIVIVDSITLSATVDETLTFTVGARTTADCNTLVTLGAENNASTSTTLPFGTLTADNFFNECQRLTIGTNASLGYSATIQTSSLPTSGGDTILQGTCDGACSLTLSAPWDTDTNNGYAFCVKDQTGDAAITADAAEWTVAQQCSGGSQAFMLIANAGASETAKAMMSSAVATTANDISDIGVRMDIGAGQQAGTYTTFVIYIVTGTF